MMIGLDSTTKAQQKHKSQQEQKNTVCRHHKH